MTGAVLRRWSAWAPGCEDADAWRAWCARPGVIASEGRPEASFLPALLRRRCSAIKRMMMSVYFFFFGF
jgi:hypothetical protein